MQQLEVQSTDALSVPKRYMDEKLINAPTENNILYAPKDKSQRGTSGVRYLSTAPHRQ